MDAINNQKLSDYKAKYLEHKPIKDCSGCIRPEQCSFKQIGNCSPEVKNYRQRLKNNSLEAIRATI